jgi:hypothetical protein
MVRKTQAQLELEKADRELARSVRRARLAAEGIPEEFIHDSENVIAVDNANQALSAGAELCPRCLEPLDEFNWLKGGGCVHCAEIA